jgi:hypothetical protein
MLTTRKKKIIPLILVFFVIFVIVVHTYLFDMHTDNESFRAIPDTIPSTAPDIISRAVPSIAPGIVPRTPPVTSGPGLPGPDGLPYMLIPESPEFERINEYQYPAQPPDGTHPPLFPGLSPYSCPGYFVKLGDDEFILVQVWYFNDYKKFNAMQGLLLKYLEANGKTDTRLLNLTIQRPDWNSTCEAAANASLRVQCYGPALKPLKQFPVTWFSNHSTAGYFFAAEHPIISSREDYFIVYYGIFNSTHPAEYLETITDLMEHDKSGHALGGQLHEIQGDTSDERS